MPLPWGGQIDSIELLRGLGGTDTKLLRYASQILSLDTFTDAYPDASVLWRDTGISRSYGANIYTDYDDLESAPHLFTGESDGRLPAKERVLALEIAGDAAAFPFRALARSGSSTATLAGLVGCRSRFVQCQRT